MKYLNFLLIFALFVINACSHEEEAEMSQIIYFGVTHGEENLLMDSISFQTFQKKILPELERDSFPAQKTIFILEGANVGIVNIKDVKEQFYNINLDTNILMFACDIRDESAPTFSESFGEFMKEVDFGLEIGEHSWEEALEAPCEIPANLIDDIKKEAINFSNSNIRFEKYLAQTAEKYAKNGYRVVVITGSVHTMRIVTSIAKEDCSYILGNSTESDLITKVKSFYLIEQIVCDWQTQKDTNAWYKDEIILTMAELPKAYQICINNIVRYEKDSILTRKNYFDSTSVLLRISKEIIDFEEDKEPTPEQKIEITLTNGDKIEAYYITDELIKDKNNIELEIETKNEQFLYKVKIKVISFAVPKNTAKIKIEEIDKFKRL